MISPVRPRNSTFRKAPSIWKHMSDAGRRMAVLGMPGTYPPEPVNGCMVSGFDAPVTTRATRSFIHPRSLGDEIMRLGGFTFADFQEFHVGPGWYRTALSRLLQGVELVTDKESRTPADALGRAVTAAALDLGLHINIVQLPGLGGVIRMAPPLTISEIELHDGVDKLEQAIAGAVAQ